MSEFKFAERLKSLMEHNKRNQKYIADVSGVTKSAVSLWLTRGTCPDAIAVLKIAQHFKVPTDYLLGNDEGYESAYNTGYQDGARHTRAQIRSMLDYHEKAWEVGENG